jgi:membrane peptidoglycan carboxypeptidase
VHSHSRRKYGSLPVLQAFALSDNPAAVNTLMEVGASTVVDYAQRLGIKSTLRAYPSLALGASEVTPLELTSAYGVFAAGGIRAEPIAIRLVKSRDGEVMEETAPRLHRVKLQPETIATMNQLTQAVVQWGTGRAAGNGVPNAHGKTGTTDDYTDAWFIGYTPDLVTGVWLGNRDNSRMSRSYGGDVSAPIWAAFMRDAVKLNPKTKRPRVDHLVAEDPKTGRRKARTAAMREEARDEEPVRPRDGAAAAAEGSEATDDTERLASGDDGLMGEVTANANNVVRVRVCDESYDLATAQCESTRVLEFVSGMQPRQICPLHGRRARPRNPKPPVAQPAADTTSEARSSEP